MSIQVRPFLGPQPFEETDSSFFYGRDREVQEFLALILSSSISLVYAKSGLGKTSIFNAKIIPELQEGEYNFEILPVVRFTSINTINNSEEKQTNIYNIYIFNTLRSIIEKSKFNKLENENLFKGNLEKKNLTNFLKDYKMSQKDEDVDRYYIKLKILIFDQFEEFFNIYIDNRLEQQTNFFYQIQDAIDNDPTLRVVFIMREEFLAYLDNFSDILSHGFRRKFRLEPLREKPAINAVEKPLTQALLLEPRLKDIIEEKDIKKIANKVVRNLLKTQVQVFGGKTKIIIGEFVEPVQLQVVCLKLWEKDILTGKIKSEIDSIEFGDVDNALIDFYDNAVIAAKKISNTAEYAIREWCEEKLITPAGTRSLVYQDSNETDGMSNKVVDVLQNKYLIRAEERSGGKWFELTHDRLIKPIKDSNKKYKEKINLKDLILRHKKTIIIITPIIISFVLLSINISHFETLFAEDKQIQTLINNNVTIKLGGNYSFPFSKYTYIIESPPKNGKVYYISNDTLIYEPSLRYTGHDLLTYIVSNGKKNSNSGSINIYVKQYTMQAINQTVKSLKDKSIILSPIDWDYKNYTYNRNLGILPIKLSEGQNHHGYLTSEIDSNKIIYTPYKGYIGIDHFEFCLPNPENTTECSQDKGSFGHVNITISPIPEYFGYLMIDNGITQGTLYPIYSTTNTIGRATTYDNPDIPIADEIHSNLDRTVSRLHGKIFYLNGSFFLQDLKSTNKILLKDKKLDTGEKAELQGGDTFVMGNTKVRFITDLTNATQYK